MTKRCPGCETEKDISQFYYSNNRKDNLSSWCKACNSVCRRRRDTALRDEVLAKLGDRCARCEFSDKRALQIDHVNGGGVKEHYEIRNNTKYLRKVLADAEGNYQILCANCNWIKRAEQGEVSCGQRYRPSKRMEGPRKPHKHSLESRLQMGESVREAWKRPGMKEKWTKAAKDCAVYKVSDEDLIAEYRKTGEVKTTARNVGIMHSCAYRRLQNLGVLVTRKIRFADQMDKILKLRSEGLSVIQIAKELGVHRATVYYRLDNQAPEALAA